MSAFRVQCETCQSWLKVRDEGFVGEVHACPKCGSMVLIAAPTEAPSTGSTAARRPAPPVMAVMSDTLEATEPPPSGVEALASAPASSSPPEMVAPSTSGATFPLALAVGLGAVAAAGVAAVAFFWLSDSQPQPTTPTQSIAVQQEVTPESPPTEADPLATAGPVSDLAEPPAETPPIAKALSEPVLESQPAAPTLPPEPIAIDPAAQDPEPDNRVAMASVAPPDETPTPEEPPAEIDPLAIDFNEVEIVLRKGAEGPPVKSKPDDELPSRAAMEPAELSLDDRLAAAAQHAGVFVRRGATNEATGPYAGSSLAALAYVVPSVDLHDIPLDKALQLVGNLAGVPITIDPVALRIVGVSASKPIDLVGESVTLADLLVTSLKPLRLGYVAEGPFVTVVRLGADEVRTISHQVADLAADDAAGLADLLRRIGGLPAEAEVIAGKLAVTAPLATQYDLVVLCERLRMARGLPTKTKYPRSLLSAEASMTTLTPVLDRRTTFSFVEPTPLADILAHWRRVTGLSILVDWRALADIGYGPRSTVECSVTNRPWRAALDGVLQGLGLTWSAVDGRTLWITTHDAATHPETIEFYPPGTIAPDGVIAAADPVSGRVLVRAAALEQRKIAEDSAVPATAGLE